MKKAGIIIGVVIVILAIVLFVVSQQIERAKERNAEQPAQTQEVIAEVPAQPEQPVVAPTEQPVVQPVEEPVEQPVTQPVDQPKSQVKTIAETDLTTLKVEKEEIVVISSKRIMLIDESYGTVDSKMLTYCFDVLTAENRKLVLFVTQSVYNEFVVGGKLKVIYKVYTNDSGIEFPIVASVSAVE